MGLFATLKKDALYLKGNGNVLVNDEETWEWLNWIIALKVIETTVFLQTCKRGGGGGVNVLRGSL